MLNLNYIIYGITAVVVLGKLDGFKGGKARVEKLSPKRRIEIAKKVALARWGED